MASNAGAVQVRTASEEFTAAMLGWPVRTFESTVPGQTRVGLGEIRVRRLDGAVVGRRQCGGATSCPKGWFYNVDHRG